MVFSAFNVQPFKIQAGITVQRFKCHSEDRITKFQDRIHPPSQDWWVFNVKKNPKYSSLNTSRRREKIRVIKEADSENWPSWPCGSSCETGQIHWAFNVRRLARSALNTPRIEPFPRGLHEEFHEAGQVRPTSVFNHNLVSTY